jgi:hypothetical protein
MFTFEIGGIATVVTDADEAKATAIFESAEVKQDLTVMITGTPLWDRQSPLTGRPASQEEAAVFKAPELDIDDGGEDEKDGDSVFVTFLVPIDHNHEATAVILPQLQS